MNRRAEPSEAEPESSGAPKTRSGRGTEAGPDGTALTLSVTLEARPRTPRTRLSAPARLLGRPGSQHLT